MAEEIQEEKKPETKEIEDGGIEVSLEEKDIPEEPKEEEEVEQKPEPKDKPKQDHSRNKEYAQDRIISKLQKEIEELKTQPPQPAVEPAADDLDKLAQTDWKAAVDKIAEKKYQQLYEATQSKIQQEAQEKERKQIQETNEQKVLSKYPELNDSSSEHSQIWFEELNKNPRWRTSPDGPILVMREMEDVLRSKGYDIDGRTTKAVSHERERLASANAASLGTPKATPSNKVVLSREQREFCDINGITYEEYARTQKKTAGGGLEL